jgi:site-specific DNA-methyltransferase (adenine-specific)
MDDIGRVFENITVCSKGNRLFNRVFRDFCDVKQSLAEFTELDTVKRYIGDIQTIFNNKIQFEEAMSYIHSIDKSMFYTQNYARNESATVCLKNKGTKVLNTKISTLVNGLLPQNLISFTPHNKLKRDMSGEGKGEFNIKHPTVKPIALMEYLIELMSNEGDVIFDPFMGSGTTMLAAKNLNRHGIGCELFEDYFNIAQSRINGVNPPQSPNTPLIQTNPIILNPNQISLL